MEDRIYFDINVVLSSFLSDHPTLDNGDRVDYGEIDKSKLFDFLAPKIVEWYNSNFIELEMNYYSCFYGGEYQYSTIIISVDQNTLNHISGSIAYAGIDSFRSFSSYRNSSLAPIDLFEEISEGRLCDHIDPDIFNYYIGLVNDSIEDIDFDIYESLYEYSTNWIYTNWQYENEDLLAIAYEISERIPKERKSGHSYFTIVPNCYLCCVYVNNKYNDDLDPIAFKSFDTVHNIYFNLLAALKERGHSYDLPDYFEIRIESEGSLELEYLVIAEDVLYGEDMLKFLDLAPTQTSIKYFVELIKKENPELSYSSIYRDLYTRLGLLKNYEAYKALNPNSKLSYLGTLPIHDNQRLNRSIEQMFKEIKQFLEKNLSSLLADFEYVENLISEDELPYSEEMEFLQFTIGYTIENDCVVTWHYQTGDNSYSGGAYGHQNPWLVTVLVPDDNPQEVVDRLKMDLENSFF
jgi:hypothetical protein